MTAFLFITILTSASLILEVIMRGMGLFLPFTVCSVFYFAYIYGSAAGIPLALIAGFLLDAVFGHAIQYSALTMLAAVPAAWILRDLVDSESALYLIPSGAFLPLFVTLPPVILRGGWRTALDLLPHLFLASVLCALMLPWMVSLGDKLGGRLALPRFRDVKAKRRRHET